MPLLYGAGLRAFTRLQEVLLKQYHDHSIFAWYLSGFKFAVEVTGMLATSPAQCLGAGDIVPFDGHPDVAAPTTIVGGVQIHKIIVGGRFSGMRYLDAIGNMIYTTL